jgi:hypothetical protein
LKGYYIQKGVAINVTVGISPIHVEIAEVAQSGERKTEDLKVASSILAFRIFEPFFCSKYFEKILGGR